MALFTNAFKIDLSLCDVVALYFPADTQTFVNAHLVKFDVIEHAAIGAFEMSMEGNVRVITHFIILYGYECHQAFFRKGLEGVVYRGLRKSGNLFNDFLIDHVCGRMGLVMGKVLIDLEPVI